MKQVDRLLLGIAGGAIALVIIAVAVVLMRPAAEYRADDSAQNIVYNYLLALQQDDYERAYGYLSSELPGYPKDVVEFSTMVEQGSGTSTFDVISERASDELATVTVRRTQYSSGDLFGGGEYSEEFTVTLRPESGSWRLVGATTWGVWNDCWRQEGGCQ